MKMQRSTTRTANFDTCTLGELRAAVEGMADMPDDAEVAMLAPVTLFGNSGTRWQLPVAIRVTVKDGEVR